MELRNCILIALAFDATPQEVDAAHDAIDRQFGGASVAPEMIVTATVPATPAALAAHTAATPIGVTTSNAELDGAGLPWDERIHSSNKKKNDKGLWWAKRNVDAGTKSRVEAELRGTVGATPVTTAPAGLPATPAPAGLPALPAAGALPPVPGAALPDPAYTAIVALIAQNTQSVANPAGRITEDWLKATLTHYGVAEGNLQNLAHNPALIPQIDAFLRQALGL